MKLYYAIYNLLSRLFTKDKRQIVPLSKIYVPKKFRLSKIGKDKWERKNNYYDNTGKFESKIIINNNYTLLDGYSSIKIAYIRGVKYVPVYIEK